MDKNANHWNSRASITPNSRIAVFQMEWALQVHTVQIVEAFVEMGLGVDVFLHAANNDYVVGGDPFAEIPNLRVFVSSTAASDQIVDAGGAWISRQTRLVRGVHKVWREFYDLANFSIGKRGPEGFAITRKQFNRIHGRNEAYLFALGVEGAGFVWASSLMGNRCPVYYYSLELFLDRHSIYHGWRFRAFKRRERYWLARSSGILIQDTFRASEFLKSACLAFRQTSIFPLPVSIRKKVHPGVLPLRKRLGMEENQVLILYLGNLEPRRGCVELCNVATGFPAEWTLVLHGRSMGPAAYRQELEAYRGHPRILFSEEMIPAEQLGDFIADCDVGLAFYSNQDFNHFHTGYSSEKIAMYFSRGIPVVANSYPSQMEVFSRWKCGLGIESFEQLSSAVTEILADRKMYEQGSLKAFDECYDFDAAKSVLSSVVEHACANQKPGRGN